ncbi:hypothetical protein V8C86DRAFT_2817164 [Haematococcus lacustris]
MCEKGIRNSCHASQHAHHPHDSKSSKMHVVMQSEYQVQVFACFPDPACDGMCLCAWGWVARCRSDLSVTQSEMSTARIQLQAAMEQVQSSRQHAEAVEGELGLTRSENQLLRKEVDGMHRQVLGAHHQLSRHRAASSAYRRASVDEEVAEYDYE